jgi:SNF2 family DNA or RNA helicase
MLDIMEKVLPLKLGRIDGSTKGKDRQGIVDLFNQDDESFDALLLSTKAAGVGLTLTGADRAIIFSPSWNPADDSQAVDR